MFALPRLIHFQDGTYEFENGLFVTLPVELRDEYRIRSYKKINSPGWTTSEFGYSAFSFYLPLGQFVTFPGLYVVGMTKPSKRFHGYKPSLEKATVEKLAQQTVALLASEVEAVQGDLAMLIHDLRALSNSIYNPAAEAQRFLDEGNLHEAKTRVDTVIAAQGILKMRTDALDFSGNAIDPTDRQRINFYKKIDKVQRCFKSIAVNQRKSVSLIGGSYASILGQDVFELVPYTIIDNAVKYSPPGFDISVFVSDGDGKARMLVKSYGPYIDPQEREAIFNKGFRGGAALRTKNPGSGLGLSIAKKIVSEVFFGEIWVDQRVEAREFDGTFYYETDFIVEVPINR